METNTLNITQNMIDAAKEYSSNSVDGFTANNPERYKAFRAGQDWMQQQSTTLLKEHGELKELESNFYMAICRAYNAGKQCMNNQHEDARNKGKEAFNDRFVSSHDYFLTEFPTFKTNVP